jgi:ferredoxin--NADP+ reductase
MYDLEVTSVIRHDPDMITFETTRPQSFRFNSGEFAMIGIDGVFRAYSMASSKYHDRLRFISRRRLGEFTNLLENIRIGDTIQIKPKATGSLLVYNLIPKQNLILLATGTGIAPFMSLLEDWDTFDRFSKVYLFHTVRFQADLVYHKKLRKMAQDKEEFEYTESVTREPYFRRGRFWDYLDRYGPGGLDHNRDAVMVCGSPELNKQCRSLLDDQGWSEANSGILGDYVVERAFVG